MKKMFILAILAVFFCTFVHSQDNSENRAEQEIKVKIGTSEGYDTFFNKNIGNDIVVVINNMDTSITGKLITVYSDGILMLSVFSEIYIPRSSIAYAKSLIIKPEGKNKDKSTK
jgi:hypothetical protein